MSRQHAVDLRMLRRTSTWGSPVVDDTCSTYAVRRLERAVQRIEGQVVVDEVPGRTRGHREQLSRGNRSQLRVYGRLLQQVAADQPRVRLADLDDGRACPVVRHPWRHRRSDTPRHDGAAAGRSRFQCACHRQVVVRPRRLSVSLPRTSSSSVRRASVERREARASADCTPSILRTGSTNPEQACPLGGFRARTALRG